ncbi:hypothetical protein Tco_1345682 [Tanacetum coccineum]
MGLLEYFTSICCQKFMAVEKERRQEPSYFCHSQVLEVSTEEANHKSLRQDLQGSRQNHLQVLKMHCFMFTQQRAALTRLRLVILFTHMSNNQKYLDACFNEDLEQIDDVDIEEMDINLP